MSDFTTFTSENKGLVHAYSIKQFLLLHFSGPDILCIVFSLFSALLSFVPSD